MNRLGFNADGITHFAQKNKPLIQRIQQRQFNVRAHDLERNAGKARTGAYADKQFLKDYENWVDRYLVLADKIVADPENPDLADQFYDMMAEADTWVARLEEISEVLVEGSEQTKQFEAEVVRISKKLEDGVNKILASTTAAPTAAPTTAAVTVNATEAA